MIDYLKELADLHGESYATHFIRERTSVGIQDEEEGKIELPSLYSSQKIYETFCYERGRKIMKDAKGA